MHKVQFPRIGMRILKSSLAVFLCFVVYLLRGEGIPFYSAIAAVLCMQPYVKNSVKVALNRIVGTLIGGGFGMLVLLFERRFIPTEPAVLQYLLVSVAIIPLIYITVVLKKNSASYITCVVFLSVTVSHGLDVSPYLFAINRVFDTLIGIFIALGVNAFHLPRRKNNDILFVTGLGGTLTGANGKLSNYTEVKLNRMLEQGAQIVIATAQSSATVAPLLAEVNLRLPIITMNGATLYDPQQKTYLNCKPMSTQVAREILSVFAQKNLNCFVHTIVNDVLHVYYSDLLNAAEEGYYHRTKLLPLRNYICSALPDKRDVVYLMAIDRLEVVQELYGRLCALGCADQIHPSYYPDDAFEGYYILEISSAEASKAEAVRDLKQHLLLDKVVSFGDDATDLALAQLADLSFAVQGAVGPLQKEADVLIGGPESDAVVRTMEKLYHSRNPFGRLNKK